MANGLLGNAVAVANGFVTVHTANANTIFTSTTVSLCNISTGDITVRLAFAAGDTPVAKEYILYNVVIKTGQTLEQSCSLMSPGEKVVVHSSSADLAIRVSGLEKAA